MLPLLFALWEFLRCESFQEEKLKQNFVMIVGGFSPKGGGGSGLRAESLSWLCIEIEWVSNQNGS